MITEDFVNDKYRFNAFIPPFFQGEETFNECMKSIVKEWKYYANDLEKQIEEILDNMSSFIESLENI